MMNVQMRKIWLLAMLFPSVAFASNWVEIGKTREARILLDQASVESLDGNVKAKLKFLYFRTQPAQTISRGSPFDSSVNLYYLSCSERKYRVLELTVFHKDAPVGSFQQPLNLDDLDEVRLDTGPMFLMNRICPVRKPATTSPATDR